MFHVSLSKSFQWFFVPSCCIFLGILFECERTWECQQGGVGWRDHSRWVVGRSVTSCSSSDMATRWSGLLSLSVLLCSVCISLSSSCRRRSTRDDTCKTARQEDASGHADITDVGVAPGYDKWEIRKLKAWVTKISRVQDARVPCLIRKHHIHVCKTVNTFILSHQQTWQDKKILHFTSSIFVTVVTV